MTATNPLSCIICQGRDGTHERGCKNDRDDRMWMWLNPHEESGEAECGCWLGYDDGHDAMFEMCILHLAADDLLEALKRAEAEITDPNRGPSGPKNTLQVINAALAKVAP